MALDLSLDHEFTVFLDDGGSSFAKLGDVLAVFSGFLGGGGDFPGTIDWGDVLETPTTLVGYGVTDAYTKAQTDTVALNAANAAVGALTAGAPEDLNSFLDAYTAFLENEEAAAALNASIAGKSSKAANLSDLTDVAAARLALGLGTASLLNVEDLPSGGGSTGPVSWNALTNKPTSIAGSGILDVYSKTQADTAATAAAQQVLSDFTAGSPDALNTFVEVYNRFLDDETAVSGLTTLVGGKLAKASNLSDLADASVARGNLGLGSAATRPVADFAPAAAGVPLGGTQGQVLVWSGSSFVWQNNPAASAAWADIQNKPTTKAGYGITDMPSNAEMTTAITTALASLTAGSPDELNTFVEAFNRFLADESALAALTTLVSGKLAKDQNLSDLTDKAAARTALGLGTAALAAASAFAPASTVGLPAFTNDGYVLAIVGGAAAWIAAPSGGTSLPSQTGNAGKVLSTDGSNPAWVAVLTAAAPGAVSLLHFDGNLNDESGRTWTASGGAVINGSQYQFGTGSLRLTGTGGLSLPADAALSAGTGDFSIQFRLRLDSVAADQCLYDTRPSLNAVPGVMIYFGQSVGGKLQLYNPVTAAGVITGTTTIVANTWYDVEVSRVSGTCRLFVNGALDVQGGSAYNVGTLNPIALGSRVDGGQGMAGYIDELRITKGNGFAHTAAFTKASAAFVFPNAYLPIGGTAGQILKKGSAVNGDALWADQYPTQAGMNGGKLVTDGTNVVWVPDSAYSNVALLHFDTAAAGLDDSGRTWSVQGSVSATQSVFGGQSLRCAGLGGVQAPQDSQFGFGRGDYSIQFRLWLDSVTADQVIYDGRNDTGATSTGPSLKLIGSTSMLQAFDPAPGGSGFGVALGNVALTAATWYDIEVSRVSGVTRIFVNGAVASTANGGLTDYGYYNRFTMGGNVNSTSFMTGYIDELRITKGKDNAHVAAFTPATAAFALPVAGGGSGTTLPTQAGNAGKFLTTSGSALSWSAPTGESIRARTRIFSDFSGGPLTGITNPSGTATLTDRKFQPLDQFQGCYSGVGSTANMGDPIYDATNDVLGAATLTTGTTVGGGAIAALRQGGQIKVGYRIEYNARVIWGLSPSSTNYFVVVGLATADQSSAPPLPAQVFDEGYTANFIGVQAGGAAAPIYAIARSPSAAKTAAATGVVASGNFQAMAVKVVVETDGSARLYLNDMTTPKATYPANTFAQGAVLAPFAGCYCNGAGASIYVDFMEIIYEKAR